MTTLVTAISFFDVPSRRGTGAPRPGLQSRYLSAPTGRTKSALIVTQDFSPGRPRSGEVAERGDAERGDAEREAAEREAAERRQRWPRGGLLRRTGYQQS